MSLSICDFKIQIDWMWLSANRCFTMKEGAISQTNHNLVWMSAKQHICRTVKTALMENNHSNCIMSCANQIHTKRLNSVFSALLQCDSLILMRKTDFFGEFYSICTILMYIISTDQENNTSVNPSIIWQQHSLTNDINPDAIDCGFYELYTSIFTSSAE